MTDAPTDWHTVNLLSMRVVVRCDSHRYGNLSISHSRTVPTESQRTGRDGIATYDSLTAHGPRSLGPAHE